MTKSLNFLLIEDDAIEVVKFNRVLKTLEVNHQIMLANNGEEAILTSINFIQTKIYGLIGLRLIKNDFSE